MTGSGLVDQALAQGDTAAAGVVEIVRIPHIDVLGFEAATDEEIVAASKQEFVSLLFEAYQSYRGQYTHDSELRETSLELRWHYWDARCEQRSTPTRAGEIERCQVRSSQNTRLRRIQR
jgi:hypothetical protein